MKTIIKLVLYNSRPIAFMIFCGCLGYFFGSFLTGLIVALTILSFMAMFFS